MANSVITPNWLIYETAMAFKRQCDSYGLKTECFHLVYVGDAERYAEDLTLVHGIGAIPGSLDEEEYRDLYGRINAAGCALASRVFDSGRRRLLDVALPEVGRAVKVTSENLGLAMGMTVDSDTKFNVYVWAAA